MPDSAPSTGGDPQSPFAVQERLRLALETTETGLWTWDVASGVVTWSTQCYAIHGVPEGGFAGTDEAFFALVHPQDRQRVQDTVGQALADRNLYECEFRIVRPGGEMRWVTNRGRARYDEQGSPVSVLGTILDITARKQAEQRLHVALEASGTGTFHWDIRSDVLSWDDQLDRLFGLEPGVHVRNLEHFIQRVHPDDRQGVVERCMRCKEHAADFEMEFRVVHPGGAIHWLYDRGRTFKDASGRPSYMTGACVDITRQKLDAAALLESERFYRKTLESVPGMTFTTNAAGEVDYLSEQWTNYTGMPATEHLGRRWVSALHEDDRPRASTAWNTAVRERSRYVCKYRMRRFDGTYRWFKAAGCVVPDEAGVPERWIGTIVDVQDLEDAQAAVHSRESELRSIADNSPDVIVRFDRQHRHVFINAVIERFTGLPMAMFLGRTNRELGMPVAMCDRLEQSVEEVFRTRRQVTIQFAFEYDGVVRQFSTRFVPEADADGAINHVLGVTRDITDAWAAQEALRRADRQKDEFLATLAHELRNPLAPLRTGLDLMQRSAVSPEERRLRQIMQRQLDHMVRLVDELLDIARISQGKIALHREPIPVRMLIEHAMDTARPLLQSRGHTFEVDAGDADWHILGDMTRLHQVLGNLLNNAAKYTSPGGHISVRASVDHDELRISVQDTGAGIPSELLNQVFDRFFQIEQHLERSEGGLGIGLSLVRSLVEMHGGRVAAESAGLDCGSRFNLWLPLIKAEARTASSVQSGSLLAATASCVLVVDDNVDAAETLAMVAGMHGHDVHVAHDGPAALALAAQHRPTLVFLDIGLPGMSGYEVARQLRALYAGSPCRLVALTGWGAPEDQARTAAAGFDLHLTKPVDGDALDEVLAGRALKQV